MPTRVIALDTIPGVSGGAGRVVAVGSSDSNLDAAGFTRGNGYRGNRRRQVDDTTAAWDPLVDVGWYWDGSKLTATPVLAPLDDLKAAIHRMLDAGDTVRAEITRLGPGQDEAKTEQAHQWMWRARGGSYLILRDVSYTIAQRKAWALANLQGPTDVTGTTLTARVLNYFTHFSGVSPANWLTFANPADAVRVTLANSIAVSGTIADDVDLVDREWVDGIQPGTGD